MTIVQAIDRKTNPVQNLTLVGGVSVVVDAGAVLLDEDVEAVTLEDPVYLAAMPDELIVLPVVDPVYAALDSLAPIVVLEADAEIVVEVCS